MKYVLGLAIGTVIMTEICSIGIKEYEKHQLYKLQHYRDAGQCINRVC
jgi:hypothetical protein